MNYIVERREVYMPEKYFKKDKHVQLTQKENAFFKLLWNNKGNSASYKELCYAIYGYEDMTEQDKDNIREIAHRIKKKGVVVKSISGYGYKLDINDCKCF